MPRFGKKSQEKLNTCDPRLVELFERVVEDFDCSKYLTDIRWNKHWKNYHENN